MIGQQAYPLASALMYLVGNHVCRERYNEEYEMPDGCKDYTRVPFWPVGTTESQEYKQAYSRLMYNIIYDLCCVANNISSGLFSQSLCCLVSNGVFNFVRWLACTGRAWILAARSIVRRMHGVNDSLLLLLETEDDVIERLSGCDLEFVERSSSSCVSQFQDAFEGYISEVRMSLSKTLKSGRYCHDNNDDESSILVCIGYSGNAETNNQFDCSWSIVLCPESYSVAVFVWHVLLREDSVGLFPVYVSNEVVGRYLYGSTKETVKDIIDSFMALSKEAIEAVGNYSSALIERLRGMP